MEPVIGGEDHQLHNGVGRGCEEVLVPVLNEEEFRYMYMYILIVYTKVSIGEFCSLTHYTCTHTFKSM